MSTTPHRHLAVLNLIVCKALALTAALLFFVPGVSLRAQDGTDVQNGAATEEQIEAPEETDVDDQPSSSRSAEGDWGVTIDAQDSTRFAEHLPQDIRGRAVILSLWGQRIVPFSDENELQLTAQGSYNWSRSDIYLNLDLLRFTAFLPESFSDSSSLEFHAGRFPFRDPSGLVLRHVGDGISLRVATRRTRVHLGAMYTGLQLNPASSIRMSGADRTEEFDTDQTFGPGRAVGMAEFRFPGLLGRQSATLALLGQYDTRTADDSEDSVHSAYAVLGLDGRLFGLLYSDLYGGVTYGSYDTGTEDSTYIGYMGSARFRVFLPRAWSSRISLRGIYMSNNDDLESYDRFLPITRSTPGTVLSIPLENIFFGELSYSIRPFVNGESLPARRVQVSATGRTFFTASDTPPVSEPFGSQLNGTPFGLQAEPAGNYVGTEAVLGLNARVRSDFGVGFTFGAFFPGTGSAGVFTDDRETEFVFRVELSTQL